MKQFQILDLSSDDINIDGESKFIITIYGKSNDNPQRESLSVIDFLNIRSNPSLNNSVVFSTLIKTLIYTVGG